MAGNYACLGPRLLLFVGMAIFSSMELKAQKDSLVLINGNVIVGTIKAMDKGVVTIETNYSKSDFTIKWSGIRELFSATVFMVTLKDGQRINGALQSLDSGKRVQIIEPSGKKTETIMSDIVYLKGLESDFWSRFKASVDAGLTINKANSLQQVTINSNVGYMADKWLGEVYYTMVTSSQDSVETTKRIDAGVNYKYFLPKDWFLAASLNFLANTEQALKLRSIGKVGIGKFFVHTNVSYWAASGGISYNNESYTNETEGRSSAEAYVGSELNLFDIGDLSLLNTIFVYPSLSESGRWRTDFKIDLKYDLPKDFYMKTGLTLNYDNQPAISGNETDYVFFFSLGWHL